MDSENCSICLQPLSQNICMVNCSAGHIFHHKCIKDSIKHGKRICPLDRQNIMKCVHDGNIKYLPNPTNQRDTTQYYVQYQQTPCYICHSNTRDDLEFDQVIVCSSCQTVFVHASCEERVTRTVFNYRFMWFCQRCRASRVINSRRRRT